MISFTYGKILSVFISLVVISCITPIVTDMIRTEKKASTICLMVVGNSSLKMKSRCKAIRSLLQTLNISLFVVGFLFHT